MGHAQNKICTNGSAFALSVITDGAGIIGFGWGKFTVGILRIGEVHYS
jgi:hypothetical protein